MMDMIQKHPGGLKLTEKILNLSGLREGNILDSGCGNGENSNFFKEKGFNVTGIDTSSFLIDKASAKYKDIRFLVGNIEKLPFSENTFDGILCECVLSILENKEDALKEFHRVLKPEGKVLWSDLCSSVEDWKDVFAEASFKCINIDYAHDEWREFVSMILWNSDSSDSYKKCLPKGINMKNLSYCFGVLEKI